MNSEEFRVHGKAMVDIICAHRDAVCERTEIVPQLEPGYMAKLLPTEAPMNGEDFKEIIADTQSIIMPGMVQWYHPNFYAYYPNGNSYPSILGELMMAGLNTLAFSWVTSPACTELENIVLDWYAKAMDLPKCFLSNDANGGGGGVMQGSASECVLVCLMTARDKAIRELRKGREDQHESVFLPQLVAYSSAMAHSSVEKAAKMALIRLRILETDARGRFRGQTLRAAIERDVAMGLTPFFVVATLGTTAACAFDKIAEIGQVCQEYTSIWLHVDAAYGGSAFILPEMQRFKEGLELADSYMTNPNKFILTNFDCSCMWVKDVSTLKMALTVNPLYLEHDRNSGINYRHYGIPLSRRFRALKLWYVFRAYGINGLRMHMRNQHALAKRLQKLIQSDARFEVCNDVYLGLVCFRLKHESDSVNQDLLKQINSSRKFHMIASMVGGKYVIRMCIAFEHARAEHIDNVWAMIQQTAAQVLAALSVQVRPSVHSNDLGLCFTRPVSQEVLLEMQDKLKDESTPILVLEQPNFVSHMV